MNLMSGKHGYETPAQINKLTLLYINPKKFLHFFFLHLIYFAYDHFLRGIRQLNVTYGQQSGVEIAVHAAVDLFDDEENHGLLQIDASNAFNSINRAVMINNIQILCPEFATFITNCYIRPSRLFVTGGKELSSKEGTTQGDPVAMSMYTMGILPLLQLYMAKENTKRIAFADDFTGIGKLNQLKDWWDIVCLHGPNLGYFPKASKSWLIVKVQHYESAIKLFEGSEVKITTEGNRHLGAIIGTAKYKEEYLSKTVDEWIKQINLLSQIAKSYPHAAYSAFVYGLQHKFTYVMRTIPDISDNLRELENAIRNNLIKAILNGYIVNDLERLLLTLPVKYGGLGIFDPTNRCQIEYNNSRKVTSEMVEKVKSQDIVYDSKVKVEQTKIKNTLKNEKAKRNEELLQNIKTEMTNTVKIKALESSMETGASSWLTTLPIQQHGFLLDKQSFWDGLFIRYGIPLKRLPTKCVCGVTFTLQHALSCPKGGFITQRHNEVRDFTAELLSECCKDVAVEPVLQEITGEQFHRLPSPQMMLELMYLPEVFG